MHADKTRNSPNVNEDFGVWNNRLHYANSALNEFITFTANKELAKAMLERYAAVRLENATYVPAARVQRTARM